MQLRPCWSHIQYTTHFLTITTSRSPLPEPTGPLVSARTSLILRNSYIAGTLRPLGYKRIRSGLMATATHSAGVTTEAAELQAALEPNQGKFHWKFALILSLFHLGALAA